MRKQRDVTRGGAGSRYHPVDPHTDLFRPLATGHPSRKISQPGAVFTDLPGCHFPRVNAMSKRPQVWIEPLLNRLF